MPLTQSVNGGNQVAAPNIESEDPWSLLDDAARRLPDPPIDVLDAQAVFEWVARASASLVFREDRRRLAREAMRILERDFQTAMNVGRLRQQLERQQADHWARQVGTYWADRDKRRRAQQPTHVDVDLDAWRAIRADAVRRGRGVGQDVGHLVIQEVTRCTSSPTLPAVNGGRRGPPGGGRRATLFARLVVTRPTWQTFRSLAAERDITVARYVGWLVEARSDAAR